MCSSDLAVAAPGSLRSLLEKSVRDAKRSGADLLVTNQSAPEIVEALAAQGWISYESNYSATFSPALAAQIDGRPYYLTRGDGDGLVNL